MLPEVWPVLPEVGASATEEEPVLPEEDEPQQ